MMSEFSTALSGPPYSANFEDFFNLDYMGLNGGASAQSSGAGGSSSRSSSNSPTASLSNLPPTPPNPMISNMGSEEADSLFHFHMDDEYLKADPLAALSMSSMPFDFLNTYDGASLPSTNSVTSPSTSTTSNPTDPHVLSIITSQALSPTAIDPQLMSTPALSKSQSDFDDDDNEHEDDEDDIVLPAYKVGGKGKGTRKGTLQSGGVSKKSFTTSAVVVSGKEKKEIDKDSEDWRPSPEEYSKMSSKEKRQLRNKISARNFRVRRKEYIHTLEGDIAERDRLIDAIRTELGTSQSENYALRQEITALKKAIEEGRAAPMLPPPAPISPLSPTLRSSSPFITPNTHKDLPTSPHVASRGFWGGAHVVGGAYTPVHTTLIPDFQVSPFLLSGKASPRMVPSSPSLGSQENINPSMNIPPTNKQQDASRQQAQAQQPLGPTSRNVTFDAFADSNPFTLKTLDAYRMQLWGQMAVQHHQREQLTRMRNAQENANSNSNILPVSAPTGLARDLVPHFFRAAKPTTSSLSALLSGKSGVTSSYPSPPPSPPLLSKKTSSTPSNLLNANTQQQQQQQAMLAAMASQTLLQRLGSAMWDAFSGSSSSIPSGSKPAWDAEKVRKVLEGKAVLKVVDIDQQPAGSVSSRPSTAVVDSSSSFTTTSLSSLSTPSSPVMTTPSVVPTSPRMKASLAGADVLEEKMRGLSIGCASVCGITSAAKCVGREKRFF